MTVEAEKSSLKQALRTNPFIQASGKIPEFRFLHGFDGDAVSAASGLLRSSKRVSGHTTILNHQRIRNFQVEVHVSRTHGPYVHINRGQANELYVRLSDPNRHTQIPNQLLNDARVRNAIMRAAFYGP